jgi:hypothetical protein
MKKVALLFFVSLFVLSCKNEAKESTADVAYASFGEKITDEEVLTKDEIIEKYKNLKSGDTAFVKFTSKVNEVCQTKGCWMKLDLGEEEAMVRFKDYGFFMPKNIADREVIVNGKAYVSEMSVEEQRHYAEDAGKTPEEIEAITEIKRTLSFEADGVLVKE